MPSSLKRTYHVSSMSSDEKTAKRSRKYSRMVSPAVQKYVRSSLARMGETKYWYDYGANQVLATAGGGTVTARNMCPVLAQGSTAYNRIGNKVKVISARIRAVVNILPYNAINNPLSTAVLVKVWLVTHSSVATNLIASTDIYTTFFDQSGGSSGFQGNPLDMVFTVNPEKWTVIEERQFKLGASTASSAGPVGTGGYYDNSPMSQTIDMDFTKAFKSQLLYNDTTNVATNNCVFLILQAVYADGSSTGSYSPAEFHYNACVKFKDV